MQNHAELTAQVGTRLYRAPEIIFLDRNYGKPVDIWSCGVVMADLFKYICTKQAGPIFCGTHCFPISNPDGAVYLEEDNLPCTHGHVLDSIFNLIGSPNQLDMAFIDDQNAVMYLQKFKQRGAADLAHWFPGVSEQGRNLLTQMLQFNPYLRPTAE